MQLIAGSNLCRSVNDWTIVINRISADETKNVVVDVETSGLNPRENFICGYVFTFGPLPEDTYYLPVRHGVPEKGNIENPEIFEQELNKISSARRDLHWIGFNLMFDLNFMFSHGVDIVGTMEDCQVNAALIDELSDSYSLDSCCIRQGVSPKKGNMLYEYMASKFGGAADKKQMSNYWKLDGDDEIAIEYACGDGISTWELREAQLIEIERQNLFDIWKIESDLTRVLFRMKKIGVKIDTDRLAVVQGIVASKIAESRKKLPTGFNTRASSQVRALMEQAGETDWPFTEPTHRHPNGMPSFNSAWLEKSEVGRDILSVRKWENINNLFLTPLTEKHIYNGRIYPNYWQLGNDEYGTISGRLSSSNPNCQQISKRDEEKAKLIRSVFVPDDGKLWYDSDLSTVEPRFLAHYSGCKALTDGYLANPPIDSHSAAMNAIEALGIDIGKDYKERRFKAKTIGMLIISGGGKARTLSLLGSGGDIAYEGYHQAMPEIKEFQKLARDAFGCRGYVISYLGRKHRLPSCNKAFIATNRILQGSNANITKLGMTRIDKLFESDGDTCNLLGSVHDSISIQAPKNKHEIIMEALRLWTDYGPAPEKTYFLKVPILADWASGRSWADASFPEEGNGGMVG